MSNPWLQPVVTGLGALLVLLAALLTVRQRYRADRRDQWWKRTQWSLELLLTQEDDATVLGLNLLTQQVRARLADAEDTALVLEVLLPWVDSYEMPEQTGEAEGGDRV